MADCDAERGLHGGDADLSALADDSTDLVPASRDQREVVGVRMKPI